MVPTAEAIITCQIWYPWTASFPALPAAVKVEVFGCN
jgi:hypothetical protein